MHVVKKYAHKAGAALVLAATVVGLCALPAQAAESTMLTGPERSSRAEAGSDFPNLEAECRRLGGARWEKSMRGGPSVGGPITYQAVLNCYH